MITMRFAIGKLDNMHDPIALGEPGEDKIVSTLVEAINVDIDDVRVATRRDGRTRRLTVTKPHSGWVHPVTGDMYFVAGGVLKKFNTDLTATTVAQLSNDLPCGFEVINSEAVVSNGADIGWLSGTKYDAFVKEVEADDPDAWRMETMGPGQFLAFWNNLLWVANGSVLEFSLPNNISTRDSNFCRIPMNGAIRMLGAVDDGLWISTDKHVSFVTGKGPDEMEFRHITDSVPAHGCFNVGFEEHEGGASRVIRWASPDGFCVGRASGAYQNLSDGIALPSGSQGFCATKDVNGTSQYIAIIRDPEAGNVFTADALAITTHTI